MSYYDCTFSDMFTRKKKWRYKTNLKKSQETYIKMLDSESRAFVGLKSKNHFERISYFYFEAAPQDVGLFQGWGDLCRCPHTYFTAVQTLLDSKLLKKALEHRKSCMSVFGCLSLMRTDSKSSCHTICNTHEWQAYERRIQDFRTSSGTSYKWLAYEI